MTTDGPTPDDFPTREQHEAISALAIESAPEAIRVEPDEDARTVKISIGSYGRVRVLDENGEDVTAAALAPLKVRVSLPLAYVATLVGAKPVAEALSAAEASWGDQRTMVETVLGNKLSPQILEALEAIAAERASIRGGA